MTEYIERKAVVDAITDIYISTAGYKTRQRVWKTKEAVQQLPTADVAPVVHGHWGDNFIPGSMLCGCSECGFTCGAYSFLYCPMCGAKMKEEK